MEKGSEISFWHTSRSRCHYIFVRCFEDENITHVSGAIDPASDIETIELELVLADLESVELRLERVARQKKSGDKQAVEEHRVLLQLQEALAEGIPARRTSLTEEERAQVRSLNLLTAKKVLKCCQM